MPSYSLAHSISATIHMGLHSSLLLLFIFFLLHPLPSHAQKTYSHPPDLYRPSFSTTVYVVVVVMVTAFFSIAFFSIYLRRCSEVSSPDFRIHAAGGRSQRVTRRGLDKAVVENFPTMFYSEVKELRLGRTSLECAVCLCEFEDAETLRLLPKCSHAFHTDCIDMWLDSHSTCPVCRSDLAAASAEVEHQQQQAPAHVAIEVDDEEESDGRVWAEEERERFTLRLPEEVRKEMMGRRLDRSATMALSKWSRGGWSFKKEWAAKSDRWAFLGRTWSLKTPRGKGEGTSNTKDDGEPSTAPQDKL